MPDRKQKFKDAKKDYLLAIKERSKALVKAVKDPDELAKYPSFVTKEERAEKVYRAAAQALHQSLHPASSRK